MDAQPLDDDLVDRLTRVQAATGILEDELRLASIALQLLPVGREHRTPEADRPIREWLQPEDRARQCRLATTALADEGNDLTGRELEVDTIDGEHIPATSPAAGVADLHSLDTEQRLAHSLMHAASQPGSSSRSSTSAVADSAARDRATRMEWAARRNRRRCRRGRREGPSGAKTRSFDLQSWGKAAASPLVYGCLALCKHPFGGPELLPLDRRT